VRGVCVCVCVCVCVVCVRAFNGDVDQPHAAQHAE
jgi:hypothetical protein